jgi:hypothetical protein
MTTRERKEQFIDSFTKHQQRIAISDVICDHGLEVFQPDIIDEIVSRLISNWKFNHRLNRENRAIHAARLARITS